MGFPQSVGITIREIDLTTVVKETAATTGAFAGVFRWGPVNDRVLVDSEDQLVARFGKPTNFNAETWFTLSSFLSYGGFAWVVRGANTSSSNASIGALTAFGNTGTVANLTAQIVR